MRIIAPILMALGAVACFGKVQIVPAAQAPKAPAGSGWFCAEVIRDSKYGTSHTHHCERTEKECTAMADATRRSDRLNTTVTTCTASSMAICSATFTDSTDANWSCYGNREECQRNLGGMAGVPGTKQSECAEVL